MTKILMVGSAEQSGGGVASVIRLMKNMLGNPNACVASFAFGEKESHHAHLCPREN